MGIHAHKGKPLVSIHLPRTRFDVDQADNVRPLPYKPSHAIMSYTLQPKGKNMAQPQIIEGTGEELIKLLNQQPNERFQLIKIPSERPFHTYEEALAQAMNRTPEEIAESRTRVIQASPAARELPEGKTLEDMVIGQWPGNETDEQILEALEKLS